MLYYIYIRGAYVSSFEYPLKGFLVTRVLNMSEIWDMRIRFHISTKTVVVFDIGSGFSRNGAWINTLHPFIRVSGSACWKKGLMYVRFESPHNGGLTWTSTHVISWELFKKPAEESFSCQLNFRIEYDVGPIVPHFKMNAPSKKVNQFSKIIWH